MQIAGFKVWTYVPEYFYLDGGAFFGAIPKVLWARMMEPDQRNRVRIANRVMVLQDSDRLILVDVGAGHRWTEKAKQIYSFEFSDAEPISNIFSSATDVILTHLHFDHAGAIVTGDEEEYFQRSFPRALHHVSRLHFEHAQKPGPRESAAFVPATLAVLQREPSDVHLCDNGEEVAPGVTLWQAHGHTPGLQWLLIEDGDLKLAFPSEMLPTSHHLSIPYVMGFDLCAATTMREKEEFLTRAAAEDWIVIFDHDPVVTAVRVARSSDGKFTIKEPVAIPLWR